MSKRFLSVDPPDLSLWPTAKGLARLWREQWRLVTVGLVCAFVYSGLSLAIPIVVRHAIDNSIAPTNGHRKALWPYLVAVLLLALARFIFNFTRRYATARTGIRVEARMRELLYQAYLRYPRAFYDRHATGQVVSRATNDLYPVRYFIGWGMTQGLQSLMMICGIAVVLFLVNPKLAAIALDRDAGRRRARVLVRAQGDADLAPGAATEGGRDRGGRRGSRRHRDGAGVRPRGRRPGALRAQGRGGARRSAAPGARRGRVPARACSSCRRSRSARSFSSAAAR